MFRSGQKVTCIGTFVLSAIAEDGFLEFDPFGRGNVEINKETQDKSLKEITADGKEKDFDGFQIGDFFILSGTFEVVRSNEIFTKIQVDDQLISIPNHKLEVA